MKEKIINLCAHKFFTPFSILSALGGNVFFVFNLNLYFSKLPYISLTVSLFWLKYSAFQKHAILGERGYCSGIVYLNVW